MRPVLQAARLSLGAQRALIATTPPATPRLGQKFTETVEDATVRHLMQKRHITTRRIDDPARTSSDLGDLHHGVVRLFDRGLLALQDRTTDTATWEWANTHAETDSLRMMRHRTLGFLPYNMGYRGLTPETMTGPELVALLVWHHRHDHAIRHLHLVGLANHSVQVITEPDTTVSRRGRSKATVLGGTLEVNGFEEETCRINPHLDKPNARLSGAAVDAILSNLVHRFAASTFGTTRLSVDLTTWRIYPDGTHPASYTETLHPDVQDALLALRAPTFDSLSDLEAWARHGLSITVRCRIPEDLHSDPDQSGSQGGEHRCGPRRYQHVLRYDPHTGKGTDVATKDSAGARAAHFLASLTGHTSELRCMLVQDAWDGNGVIANTEQERWSHTQADRVLAIHLVGSAVRAAHSTI